MRPWVGLMPWPFGNRRGDGAFLFLADLSWSYERGRFNVGKKGIGSVLTGEMVEVPFLSFFRGDLGAFSDALSSSVALPPVSVSVSLPLAPNRGPQYWHVPLGISPQLLVFD